MVHCITYIKPTKTTREAGAVVHCITYIKSTKTTREAGAVVQVYSSATWEVEAGRALEPRGLRPV